MQKVDNIEQLKSFVDQIRDLHQGFVTNFYLDEEKHRAWLQTGEFFCDQFSDTVFLLFNHEYSGSEEKFTNLFYISTSFDNVITHLRTYNHPFINHQYVLDIVGRTSMCQSMMQKLNIIGVTHANTLMRMNRVGNMPMCEMDSSVSYANDCDIPWIEQWLHSYFDAKLEQIPLVEELQDYINRHWILQCKIDGDVAGFLIFEKNASTLHLRYWFTHPKYRGQKVGSKLLHRFFFEGKDTKRQILWVLCDNENAIKRYEHYGFISEDMFDYIYFY